MGFVSFNIEYYKNELQKLQTAPVSEETLYRAKQLLKILDDLLDEGYTVLNNQLEEACAGVSGLRAYIKEHGAEPFATCRKPWAADVAYEPRTYELISSINAFVRRSAKSRDVCCNALLHELIAFCQWIGYKRNTAYIFLLRDALLPYICYLHKRRQRIYPWLLGRKTLAKLAGKADVDDEMRATIYAALQSDNCRNFDDFCRNVLPQMRNVAHKYPAIETTLKAMLGNIAAERIVVVESGCSGTLPMLLMSLDSRVDLRMFTTYPYLLEVYGDKIFSPKYENARMLETLYSQDLYFRFSDLRDGKFFVEKCSDREIEKTAIAEVKSVLQLAVDV